MLPPDTTAAEVRLQPLELPPQDVEIVGTKRQELKEKLRVMVLVGPKRHVRIVVLEKRSLVKLRLQVQVREGLGGTKPHRQLQEVPHHLAMQLHQHPRAQHLQ